MMVTYRKDLWRLCRYTGLKGDAAEIGVAEGFFSFEMLEWPIDFPTVYMVDRWKCIPDKKGDSSQPQEWHDQNLADARARVAPFGDRAVILQGESAEMARRVPDKSLIVCYIDADHSYEGVKSDIAAWSPKVKAGGIMAFHDYEDPAYGVKRAVREFCQNRYHVFLLPENELKDAGAYFICS